MDSLRTKTAHTIQGITKQGELIRDALSDTADSIKSGAGDARSIAQSLKETKTEFTDLKKDLAAIKSGKRPKSAPNASGFVPNLSVDPLQRAMKTERAMGGSPQLEWARILESNRQ